MGPIVSKKMRSTFAPLITAIMLIAMSYIALKHDYVFFAIIFWLGSFVCMCCVTFRYVSFSFRTTR